MERGVDYTTVSPARRLESLAAIRRERCELDAAQTQILAAIAEDQRPWLEKGTETVKQWAREDVACALRVPPATVGAMFEAAHEIAYRFPASLEAMWDADLTVRMAERLADSCMDLPDRTARQVETRVLRRAGSQTFSQFAHSVRRAVAVLDPRGSEAKHEADRALRKVVFTALEHGMTELFAVLPADHAAELRAAVEFIADGWRGLDERTADQRRADALHALAIWWSDVDDADEAAADTTPDVVPAPRGRGSRAVINVTVPLSVLLGLDDRCGELDDHGPIPGSVARRLAAGPNTVWRRLVVDPVGRIVDVSANTYRPPAAMGRYVQLRDRTCRFPGCNRRATRCEIDHLQPWLRSRDTSPENLICLCSRHHHLKHEAGWTIHRDSDHTVRWTNPTGRTYTRPPPEPPPF